MVKRGKLANSSMGIRFSSLWKKHALGGGRLLAAFSIPLLFSWFIASSVIIPYTISNTSATESTDKNTSTSTTTGGFNLSISVPKTVTIDLIPNPNGSFSYSELNTQVTTTNPTGYTLSFNASDSTGNTNANELINTNTNITTNNTIPSITNDTNQSNFPTNSWGYSINDNNANINTLTFKPIPLPSSSASDKQLKTTDTASASGDNTKLIIGLKANNNLSSGSYTGQLTFSAVANALPLTFSGITNMQDMTPAICAAETTPTNTATQTTTVHSDDTNLVPEAILTDSRDGNTYVVRKLADGRCWMAQNLRLGTNPDGSAITSPITLNSTDSNIASGTFTLTTSSNSFGTTNDAAGINIVRMHDNGNAYINDNYTNATQTVSTTGTPTSQTNYLGNYYNWYTATAGTGTYAMSTTGVNATSSICPKGWRLPKGGAINASTGNGEFQILYNTYDLTSDAAGSIKLRRPPISAVLSGAWNDTSAVERGSYGLWWSSTIDNTLTAYDLDFRTSNVYPQDVSYKGVGLSVRCIAEPATIATINTMQDMTSDVCAASAIGDNKALRDTRDGNTYMVRKMEDNKCWMTQNLRLGSTSAAVTLTSADSDVTADFTIPTSAVQTSGNTDWGPYNDATAVNTVHVYNNGNSWIQPTSSGSASTVNTTGTPPNQSQYIGNHYNWYTATAGTGTYGMSTRGDNATSSICPKGWKLPTGGANSDITGLTNALIGVTDSVGDSAKSFTMQSAPNYFVLSGIYGAGVIGQGSNSSWWFSTANSSTSAYRLYLFRSYVGPQDDYFKDVGLSVRCVAR